MRRRYSERLLVALVCAQVVAGCGAAESACAWIAERSISGRNYVIGDKCGLPPARPLPPAGPSDSQHAFQTGLHPACGFADGPERRTDWRA